MANLGDISVSAKKDAADMGAGNKKTGTAVYPAIVWQDRRTADACARLQQHEGLGERVAARTGLLLDPYFSATKLAWILDNVAGARARA